VTEDPPKEGGGNDQEKYYGMGGRQRRDDPQRGHQGVCGTHNNSTRIKDWASGFRNGGCPIGGGSGRWRSGLVQSIGTEGAQANKTAIIPEQGTRRDVNRVRDSILTMTARQTGGW